MDNLQPIILGNLNLIPASSGDDLSVEFHGDLIPFETKGQNDAGQG
jgi:hypothetical protein